MLTVLTLFTRIKWLRNKVRVTLEELHTLFICARGTNSGRL